MKTSDNQSAIFPKGGEAPAEYFTGNVSIRLLVPVDSIFNTQVGNVFFEPCARTNWHTHPGGQILLITDGVGYYKEKGKAIQVIRKGDVVTIPPDIEHWHGASPDSDFTHIAINTNSDRGMVVWLGRVAEQEYNELASNS